MGRLYDACQYVIGEIDQRGLDPFKSRGALALEVGFLISTIQPSDPDDLGMLHDLREAARQVLQIEIPG